MFDHPKVLSLALVLILSGLCHADVLYVSIDDSCNETTAYGTIQEAVDAAAEGDEIIVCSSVYEENIIVDKSVNISGNDSSNPAVIIADIASNPVVTLEADNVVLSNLVLQDATGSYGLFSSASYGTIENIVATNNDIGFYFEGSSHNTIISNTAHDNFDEGFRLDSHSDDNILTDNVAYNQLYYGFYIHESSNNVLISNEAFNSTSWYGFFIHADASGNALEDNVAHHNAHHGFHVYQSTGNELTGNNAYANSEEGFRLSSSSGNLLEGNIAYDNEAEGFRLSSSSDNTLTENEAYDNLQNGFLVSSSSENTLTDNEAYDNALYGFYIHMSSDNSLESNTAYGQLDGFRLFGSSGNRLTSNTAYGNNNGFYFDLSDDNSLEDNEAHDNIEHGFLLSSCSDNRLEDNEAHDNGEYGFYVYLGAGNSLQENEAYGNLNGFRVSSSSDNRLEANFAHLNSRDGIHVYLSSNNAVVNNTAANNARSGIYLHESPGNLVSDNIAADNARNGIYVYLSPETNLRNNEAYGNGADGFVVSSSSETTMSDNEAYENSGNGFSISLSPSSNMGDNSAHHNSGTGVLISSSTNSHLRGQRLYENGADLSLVALSSSMHVRVWEAVFDSAGGAFEDYTVLSIDDVLESNTSYAISWTHMPAALPHPFISFENKYLDISSPGTISIDSITWHWLDSESSGYEEKKFYLWQYDAEGWLNLGGTLNESNNTLSLSGLVPESTYGILQNRSVPVIQLHNPFDEELLNTTEITMNWTVYSHDPTSLCNIIMNGNPLNGAPITATSDTCTDYSAVFTGDGIYVWNVSCWDSIGTNNSETRTFSVDMPPLVELESPGSEFVNSSDYDIEFTVLDNSSSSLDCYLYVDDLLEQTSSVQEGELSSLSAESLPEGEHEIYIICEDEAGNTGVSETKELTVDTTAPSVTLLSPEDDYLGNESLVTFSFTVSDDISTELVSSLYIDDILEGTTDGNEFIISVSPGEHQWYVTTADEAGNTGTSETRTLALDQSAPTITLLSPPNGERIVTEEPQDVEFRFTASDDSASQLHCIFYLDDDAHALTMDSGNTISRIRLLSLGSHRWYVECTDDVNNLGTTPSRSLSLGPAGSSEDDSDSDDEPAIKISRSQNCPGDSVTFTVSSGAGTVMRLLDSENLLVDSGNADSDGRATFDIDEAGWYEIRASKSSYESAEKQFYYSMCTSGNNEDDDSGEEESVDEGPGNVLPEEQPEEQEADENDDDDDENDGHSTSDGSSDGADEPEVEIVLGIEDGIVNDGDTIVITVYVDKKVASVRLEITAPDGSLQNLMTDGSGQASYMFEGAGKYKITVTHQDLPKKSVYVDVLKRELSDYEKPHVQFIFACIPMFLLLLLFLMIAYMASRKANQSDKKYKGYRKKESIVDKIRKALRS